MENPIETTNVKKMNQTSIETPSSIENNRIKSNIQSSSSYHATMNIRVYYEALTKSKFLVYFCLLLYICICLLGNIVTGVILHQHQNSSPSVDDIAPIVPINVSKEYTEEEYFDLYQLFMNETTEQVSNHLSIS